MSDHETTRSVLSVPLIIQTFAPLDICITHDSKHEALSSGAILSCTPQEMARAFLIGILTTPVPSICCVLQSENYSFDDGEFEGAPIAALHRSPVPLTPNCLVLNIMDMIVKRLGPSRGPILPVHRTWDWRSHGKHILVSWDDFYQLDRTAHKDFGQRLDQINLHEMAHTWFGDLIVCRDYAHVWLKSHGQPTWKWSGWRIHSAKMKPDMSSSTSAVCISARQRIAILAPS